MAVGLRVERSEILSLPALSNEGSLVTYRLSLQKHRHRDIPEEVYEDGRKY
jgi:hypothetical protein